MLRGSLVRNAAKDGRSAIQLASGKIYDVLIVDLGLPDQDGIDPILQLRRSGISSPVLILSARRSVDNRVKGLEGFAPVDPPIIS